MLEVSNLSRPGLGPISFSLADGAALAISGPSGAGKSLLLRAIADLDPHDGTARTGRIACADVPAPQWRRAVALVPAESGWWADAVAEHFHTPEASAKLLPALGLPAAAMGWQVARLSTGERHRLAILRALEMSPEVLLLDEPTAALDDAATAALEALLKAEMARGLTLVVVTHDGAQPARLGARVLQLENGRLHGAGRDGATGPGAGPNTGPNTGPKTGPDTGPDTEIAG